MGKNYTIVESFESSLTTQTATSYSFKEPVFVKNTLKKLKQYEKMKFCSGAEKLRSLPNAGGNSIHSETLSFDMLHLLFSAKLEATEMQLQYFPLGSKITDYSVRIRGEVFGVSVTRAMKYKGTFTREDGERLLHKKLYGVNASTEAVIKCYRWEKQILHVFAQHQYIVEELEKVYRDLPPYLKNNTIVLVTVCENDPWIFFEKKVV